MTENVYDKVVELKAKAEKAYEKLNPQQKEELERLLLARDIVIADTQLLYGSLDNTKPKPLIGEQIVIVLGLSTIITSGIAMVSNPMKDLIAGTLQDNLHIGSISFHNTEPFILVSLVFALGVLILMFGLIPAGFRKEKGEKPIRQQIKNLDELFDEIDKQIKVIENIALAKDEIKAV